MTKENKNIEQDKIIEDLFSHFTPDKPSVDFTKSTMNEVFKEWSKQPAPAKVKINTANKIWISLSIALGVILVYVIDIKNASKQSSTIAESLQFSETLKAFNGVFNTIFHSFSQVPTLAYIIILGISMILILDKMLSKIIKTA